MDPKDKRVPSGFVGNERKSDSLIHLDSGVPFAARCHSPSKDFVQADVVSLPPMIISSPSIGSESMDTANDSVEFVL